MIACTKIFQVGGQHRSVTSTCDLNICYFSLQWENCFIHACSSSTPTLVLERILFDLVSPNVLVMIPFWGMTKGSLMVNFKST